MSAVARLAEQNLVPTYIEFDPSKWFYGAGVLTVLLLLLWIVTRINIDR